MTDTQGSTGTVGTGSQAVTSYTTECRGVNVLDEECPLKKVCLRTALPSNPWRPFMMDAPFIWSDYMLIEQGYDPVYCEFYIFKGSDDGTTKTT